MLKIHFVSFAKSFRNILRAFTLLHAYKKVCKQVGVKNLYQTKRGGRNGGRRVTSYVLHNHIVAAKT